MTKTATDPYPEIREVGGFNGWTYEWNEREYPLDETHCVCCGERIGACLVSDPETDGDRVAWVSIYVVEDEFGIHCEDCATEKVCEHRALTCTHEHTEIRETYPSVEAWRAKEGMVRTNRCTYCWSEV